MPWLTPDETAETTRTLLFVHAQLRHLYILLREHGSTICAGQVATAGMLLQNIVTNDLAYEQGVEEREDAMVRSPLAEGPLQQ